MSVAEIIIRLTAVVVLASYLYVKHRQRVYRYSGRNDAAEWTGTAIDAQQLKERVDRVRRNYLAERQPSPGVCYHRGLLGFARRTVARLAYFRDREAEDHSQKHTS